MSPCRPTRPRVPLTWLLPSVASPASHSRCTCSRARRSARSTAVTIGLLIPVKTPSIHWPQVYLCVALTTLATLLLELSLTRIFSVVFYYHLAFLAISIALFGLGAGGVFSYVVGGWKGDLYRKLGALAVIDAISVVLA